MRYLLSLSLLAFVGAGIMGCADEDDHDRGVEHDRVVVADHHEEHDHWDRDHHDYDDHRDWDHHDHDD